MPSSWPSRSRLPVDLSIENIDNSPGSVAPEVVVGTDSRKIITDTTVYPWRAVCRIVSTYPDGTQTAGSGALIGDRYVLTVAHNIFLGRTGVGAVSIEVAPGQNGLALPFGAFRVVKSKAGFPLRPGAAGERKCYTIGNSVTGQFYEISRGPGGCAARYYSVIAPIYSTLCRPPRLTAFLCEFELFRFSNQALKKRDSEILLESFVGKAL